MNTEMFYQRWKSGQTRTDFSGNFTDRVMKDVRDYQRTRRQPWFDRYALGVWLSTHRLAQAGLVIASALIGLMRLTLVWRFILS